MAGNLHNRAVANFGKRFVNQVLAGGARDPARSPSISLRRGVHVSVYDKNPDEQICPTVVPDGVIEPQSEKYWGPDPQTGVFGPVNERGHTRAADIGESVLEQKTFFRPLEDLENPPPEAEDLEKPFHSPLGDTNKTA